MPKVDARPGSAPDDELAAEAMAADPDRPLDGDAVSFWDVVEPEGQGLLPDWYMPAPRAGARRLRGWPRRIALFLVAALLLINGYGMCVTYGIGS